MISISTGFTYDNENSENYGVISARLDSNVSYQVGLAYEPQYEKIKYVDKVLFYGNDKSLLEFNLELYKETMWTIEDRKKINRWLFKNDFRDLIFANYSSDIGQVNQVTGIVYNCQPFGQPEAVDYGGLFGLKIKFLNSLPYPTTKESIQYFDLSDNTSTTQITIENRGNMNEYFYDTILEFTLVDSSTGISLVNLSDGGYTTTFTGLSTGETITINNSTGDIISSTGIVRHSKFNMNYLRLPYGKSKYLVTGKCKLKVTGKYPIII